MTGGDVFIEELFTGVGGGAGTGAGAALLDENQERLAGVGEGTVGVGELATVAPFFFEGLVAVVVDGARAEEVVAVVGAVVVAAGASFFLERLCFAGDASALATGVGACASNEAVEKPIKTMIKPMNLFIPVS